MFTGVLQKSQQQRARQKKVDSEIERSRLIEPLKLFVSVLRDVKSETNVHAYFDNIHNSMDGVDIRRVENYLTKLQDQGQLTYKRDNVYGYLCDEESDRSITIELSISTEEFVKLLDGIFTEFEERASLSR